MGEHWSGGSSEVRLGCISPKGTSRRSINDSAVEMNKRSPLIR